MEMEKCSEAEKGCLELNPDGEEDNKTEELGFKPKVRSVIPAQRKLVKTMILLDIVQFWSDISNATFSTKAKASNVKKKMINSRLVCPTLP